jgi:hypothetical protein
MYNERQYLIFLTTQLSKVDFTQVLETSEDTVRKSIDSTKTFVKWSGEQPSFVSTLDNTEGPYTHDEIIEILSTEEWSSSINEMI